VGVFLLCFSTTPVAKCGYVGSQCGFCGKDSITSDPHPARTIRGLLEKYPTFGREKETGLLGALDT
jgi:hypothetical protein